MKNLGGSFHLAAQPGKGTCIRLEAPIKADPVI
jgi:signal transduction histidine kinase